MRRDYNSSSASANRYEGMATCMWKRGFGQQSSCKNQGMRCCVNHTQGLAGLELVNLLRSSFDSSGTACPGMEIFRKECCGLMLCCCQKWLAATPQAESCLGQLCRKDSAVSAATSTRLLLKGKLGDAAVGARLAEGHRRHERRQRRRHPHLRRVRRLDCRRVLRGLASNCLSACRNPRCSHANPPAGCAFLCVLGAQTRQAEAPTEPP